MRVIGNAGHIALRLLDRVLIRAGLRVGDLAEREVRLVALGRLANGNRRLLRHRRTVGHRFKREVERTVRGPLGALQFLGERHARRHTSELLGLVGVRERVHTVLEIDAGDQAADAVRAVALVGNGERHERRAGVVRQAILAFAGALLAHVVHVRAGLAEREPVERERGGTAAVRLADRHGRALRHGRLEHTLRHAGLASVRRQFERERFVALPITAGDRLREPDCRLALGDRVRVSEVRHAVRLTVDLGLGRQCAIAFVDHFDAHRMFGQVIGHTVLGGRILRHAFRQHLADRVPVGLAGIVLREREIGEQCAGRRPHELLPTDRGERVRGRHALRAVGHGGAVDGRDREAELLRVHRTAGERLADAHRAVRTIVHLRGVGVGEGRAAVRGRRGRELAVAVGHRVGHGVRVRVVGPAVHLGIRRARAVRQLLAHGEGVGAGHGEDERTEVDVRGRALRDQRRGHRGSGPVLERAVRLLDLDVLRVVGAQCGIERELAGFGVTPRHRLGHAECLRVGVLRTVRVRQFHALAAVRIGDGGGQVLLLVTRDGDLHVVGVDVVGHAVLRRFVAVHIFRHDFAHVVGEGLLVLPVERLVRELERTRPRAVNAHRDVRLERRPVGWVALVRRDHDIERAHHIVRLGAGVVGVVLDAPDRGHGLVLTHEGVREVGGFCFRLALDMHAVVTEGVRQHGGRTHRAVTVVGHGHCGDVAGAGVLHARLAATLLGDHVLVRAGLGVGDRTECERDAIPILVCVRTTRVRHGHSPLFRHRRFGIGVTGRNLEREGLIGLPITLHKRLSTTDRALGERHRSQRVLVDEAELGRFAGRDAAFIRRMVHRPALAAGVGLCDGRLGACGQAVDHDRFAMLEAELRTVLHGGVLPGDHGLVFAVGTDVAEGEGERERLVLDVLRHLAIGPFHDLGDLKRTRACHLAQAVVAEVHRDVVHLPMRGDRVRRGAGRVGFLCSCVPARESGTHCARRGIVMPVSVRDRFTFRIRAKHLDPLLMLRVVRVVRALVVVCLLRFDRRRRVVQTLGVVQRRVLREVVEVVCRGWREHGGRAAVGAIGRRVVRVRQEAHTAVGVDVGLIGEILSHLLIGIRHLRQGAVFEVDLVEQAHRVRACDARRHVAVFVHLRRVQAQR